VPQKAPEREPAARDDPVSRMTQSLLFDEEAKSELMLNRIIVYACLPALVLVVAAILAVQGVSPNALFDAAAILLLAAYCLPERALLRRRGYRRTMKYSSVAVIVTIVSLTLVSYSYPSGWVHSSRSVVASGYVVAIIVAGLYHDPKLPLLAAAMSALQYSCIAAYAVFAAGVGVAPIETFRAPEYSFDVYAFLLFCFIASGAVSAYGCSRFRATLSRSLSSEASSKALAELDAQKTFFFSNVSHELRTPLTLILSPLETMLSGDQGPIPAKHREYLAIVHQNALRLLKLINNLLDFNKLEAGKMRLARQKTDMAEAVAYYLSAIRPTADARGLALELEVDGGGPCLACVDRGLFEKAFLNLLSNALKFTEPGGSIRVALRHGAGRLELSVSDTGIGIPADKLEFIFERFSQVDSTLTRKYEGSGIGLSLAKDVIELHGGRIACRSELGKGSVFVVSMPAGEIDPGAPTEPLKAMMPSLLSDLALPAAPAAAPSDGRRGACAKKVLVVDDNRELREYLASFLGEEFEVVSAADGNEGLAKARIERPDIIVSDVMMPGMNGYALCSEIKRDPGLSPIPVILLTARAEASMKTVGYELGADDYLGKPFNAEELLAKIRVFLGREEMRRKLDVLAGELRASNEFLEERVLERTRAVERQFYQILDSLAAALEEKDPYTQGHSLRVEAYSMALAAELGLSAEDRMSLSIAARLHDIGKIGIPEHILNKAGALDEAELAAIRTHPARGARILAPLSGIEPIAEAARKHHERYDGRGYFGYPREEVPMLARILAVADAYDAMTTTRAYRPAMGKAEALAEIGRCAGSQFDPEVASAFIAAMGRGAASGAEDLV
jgi:response regulator RpfG family c-di-GMP phosphodiesterase/signal transduction histidine kinase